MTPNPMRGLLATRVVKCMAVGKSYTDAFAYASSLGPEYVRVAAIIKAAVDPVDETSGGALISDAGWDLSEFIRPQTIIGKLVGLRRVPFATRLLTQTALAGSWWVGSGAPIPMTEASFAGDSLPMTKIAAALAVTDELARSSAPSAESALSQELNRACAWGLDVAFIDPANTGDAATPASITSTATATEIPSTGSAVANIDADSDGAIDALVAAGSTLQFAAWVMNTRSATFLSRVRGTGGAAAYRDITVKGGMFRGLPVITSPNVPIGAATSALTSIVLLDASEVTLCDDGDAEIGIARHANVEMSDTPTGTSAPISLWQNSLVGIKIVMARNWKLRRAGMCQLVSGVSY